MKESIADIKRQLRVYGEPEGRRMRVCYVGEPVTTVFTHFCCSIKPPEGEPPHFIASGRNWRTTWEILRDKIRFRLLHVIEEIEAERRAIRNQTTT